MFQFWSEKYENSGSSELDVFGIYDEPAWWEFYNWLLMQ